MGAPERAQMDEVVAGLAPVFDLSAGGVSDPSRPAGGTALAKGHGIIAALRATGMQHLLLACQRSVVDCFELVSTHDAR